MSYGRYQYGPFQAWPSYKTSYDHLNNKVEKLRRDLDRQTAHISTVGSAFASATPARYRSKSRPLSAMRNTNVGSSTMRKSWMPDSHCRPASVGRKYYPRYSTEPFDTAAVDRRRAMIDQTLRRYEDEKVSMRDECNQSQRSRKCYDMQEDLIDLKFKVHDRINTLHVKEHLLKDGIDRLASDRQTVGDYPDISVRAVEYSSITRPRVQRRQSFGVSNR